MCKVTIGIEIGIKPVKGPLGIVFNTFVSFSLTEFRLKLVIPIKVWTNPGTFLLDLVSGGTGSNLGPVAKMLDALWNGLKKAGMGLITLDCAAGLYLGIDIVLLFKTGTVITPEKLVISIYLLWTLWVSMKIKILFIKITIIDLALAFTFPGLRITVGFDKPIHVDLTLYLIFKIKFVLFCIKILNTEKPWDIYRFHICGNKPCIG